MIESHSEKDGKVSTDVKSTIVSKTGKGCFLVNENLSQEVNININTKKEKTLGKTKGSDIAKNKSTYTSLLGLDKAREHANKHFDKAMEILEQLPGDHSLLEYIAKNIVTRNF